MTIQRLLVATLLVSGCAASSDPATASSPVDTTTALLVKNRTRLEVCVQIDPALHVDPETILARLRDDLTAVSASHPDWHPAGLDRATPAFTLGCPEPLVTATLDPKSHDGIRATNEPGPFRVHVHVLGEALATTVLADQPSVKTATEFAHLDDHTIVEVSSLLAIRASALGTTALRDTALPRAIGLRSLAIAPVTPAVDL